MDADQREVLERDGKVYKSKAGAQITSIFSFLFTALIIAFLLILSPIFWIINRINSLMSKKPVLDQRPLEEKFEKLTGVAPIPMAERKYDIVLFGVTGFTGKLAAKYVADRYGTDLKWAIAGRNKKKLEGIRDYLKTSSGNDDLADLDLIVADTGDESTLEALVSNTRTIVSTVGPFAKYGSSLVKYCVAYATHYADTTGEAGWVRDMISVYGPQAQETGARIINLCGNDCIPWDLCALMLTEKLQKERTDEAEEIKYFEFLNTISGGFSGGTLATLVNSLTGPKASRPAFDPLLTLPDGSKSENKTRSEIKIPVGYSKVFKNWYIFSPLGNVNMLTVKRSNALLNYGSKIVYKEQNSSNSFIEAHTSTIKLTLTGFLLSNPLLRGLALSSGILPKPGEGPSEAVREAGYLLVKAHAAGTKGTVVEGWAYWPSDPGYKDTARMVVESALCMALDLDKCPDVGGGLWTPAYGLGHVLADRLANSGTEWHF